jgi:transposase
MTKKGAVAARTAAVKRRTFTREFKLKVIREVEAGKSQAQVAREYQITENTISKWRRQHRQYQDRAFAGRGHAYTDEARMHELERMVGRLTMENGFLRKLLQKLESENRVQRLAAGSCSWTSYANIWKRDRPPSGALPSSARRSVSRVRLSGVSYASPAPLATMSWSCARRFKPSLLRCVLTVIAQSPQNCTVVASTQSRALHAHAQVRRDLHERLRNTRRGTCLDRAFH